MSNVFATLITFFCFRHLNYGSIYYISRLYWHAPRWSVDTVFNFHHSLHINQLNQYFLGFSGHSQILSLVLLVLFIAACHTCKELKFLWCWQPTESNDKNLTAVSVVVIFYFWFSRGARRQSTFIAINIFVRPEEPFWNSTSLRTNFIVMIGKFPENRISSIDQENAMNRNESHR